MLLLRCRLLLSCLLLGLPALAGCVSVIAPPIRVESPEQALPEPEPIGDPAAQAPPVRGAGLAGSLWRVVAINGETPAAGSEPSLDFSVDGRVSGNGSCNRFAGEAAISTNEIAFSRAVSTRMACDPDRLTQEATLLRIIEGVVQWRLEDGDVLTLRGPGGTLSARRG
jgi:heat shock protein HslJ